MCNKKQGKTFEFRILDFLGQVPLRLSRAVRKPRALKPTSTP